MKITVNILALTLSLPIYKY